MSVYTESQNWLSQKHRTLTKSCVYGFSCHIRESDWDFADIPSRGYSFASEEAPIHLLNNSGGMDEEEIPVKDVWYPHQAVQQAEDADSEMCDDQSSSDDMDIEIVSTTANSDMVDNQHQQPQYNPSAQPQQFPQQINSSANKRKRCSDSLEQNTDLAPFGFQQPSGAFDNSKRVRVSI